MRHGIAGGTSGAAAVAAGRAAALGAAASSRGYSSLGGISEQKEELRKLVTLPLQVDPSLLWRCLSCAVDCLGEWPRSFIDMGNVIHCPSSSSSH